MPGITTITSTMRKDDFELEETGFLTGEAKEMIEGVKQAKEQLERVKKELKENPSDPSVLAGYQTALSEYNLYRNAQSNMIKAYKDIGAAIITNFKN